MRRARLRAFEQSALVHLDELFRAARRFSTDRSQAEDLVQETFLRAWEGFDRFAPGTNCRAWLYRIFFRSLSARRHELQRELAMFDAEPFDDERPPRWRERERLLTPHQIENAFAALPVAFATVITLIDIEGLSYKEAASVLEVPVGTVMSRLHRGRRLLRERLCPAPRLLVVARGNHD